MASHGLKTLLKVPFSRFWEHHFQLPKRYLFRAFENIASNCKKDTFLCLSWDLLKQKKRDLFCALKHHLVSIESFMILIVCAYWPEKTTDVSRRPPLATNELWVVLPVGWTSFKKDVHRAIWNGKGKSWHGFFLCVLYVNPIGNSLPRWLVVVLMEKESY